MYISYTHVYISVYIYMWHRYIHTYVYTHVYIYIFKYVYMRRTSRLLPVDDIIQLLRRERVCPGHDHSRCAAVARLVLFARLDIKSHAHISKSHVTGINSCHCKPHSRSSPRYIESWHMYINESLHTSQVNHDARINELCHTCVLPLRSSRSSPRFDEWWLT